MSTELRFFKWFERYKEVIKYEELKRIEMLEGEDTCAHTHLTLTTNKNVHQTVLFY